MERPLSLEVILIPTSPGPGYIYTNDHGDGTKEQTRKQGFKRSLGKAKEIFGVGRLPLEKNTLGAGGVPRGTGVK